MYFIVKTGLEMKLPLTPVFLTFFLLTLFLPSVYISFEALGQVSGMLFFQSIDAEQELSFRRSNFKIYLVTEE